MKSELMTKTFFGHKTIFQIECLKLLCFPSLISLIKFHLIDVSYLFTYSVSGGSIHIKCERRKNVVFVTLLSILIFFNCPRSAYKNAGSIQSLLTAATQCEMRLNIFFCFMD